MMQKLLNTTNCTRKHLELIPQQCQGSVRYHSLQKTLFRTQLPSSNPHTHQKLTAEVEADIEKMEDNAVGDAVPDLVVNFIQHWFRTIHSGADIQEVLKQCERPANCTTLKMVEINPEVKKYMQKPDIIKDQRFKWMCNGAVKLAQPLAKAWASLSELEFAIQQEQDAEEDVQDAMVPITKDKSMNLSAVIRDIKHGLKCLGMLHVQMVQKRHLELRDKLSGAAKELSEVNTPFDDLIFGADMEKSVTKIIQANKISKKISSPLKRYSPFLARGCRRCGGGFLGSHFRYNNPPQHHALRITTMDFSRASGTTTTR